MGCLESDCAALADLLQSLITAGLTVHCLRDLTRGGLASALVEIAEAATLHLHIDEQAIPVCEDVQGACELLVLEPLYVANEGRLICFVSAAEAERALGLMRTHPLGYGACTIGRVATSTAGLVTMQSCIGTQRVVDMLSGEQLLRIC